MLPFLETKAASHAAVSLIVESGISCCRFFYSRKRHLMPPFLTKDASHAAVPLRDECMSCSRFSYSRSDREGSLIDESPHAAVSIVFF